MNRTRLLTGTLTALAIALCLLVSPRFTGDVYAAAGGCSVRCPDGTSCEKTLGAGERCTCTCELWGHGPASCTCTSLKPVTPG